MRWVGVLSVRKVGENSVNNEKTTLEYCFQVVGGRVNGKIIGKRAYYGLTAEKKNALVEMKQTRTDAGSYLADRRLVVCDVAHVVNSVLPLSMAIALSNNTEYDGPRRKGGARSGQRHDDITTGEEAQRKSYLYGSRGEAAPHTAGSSHGSSITIPRQYAKPSTLGESCRLIKQTPSGTWLMQGTIHSLLERS